MQRKVLVAGLQSAWRFCPTLPDSRSLSRTLGQRHQIGQLDLKRLRDPDHHHQAWIAPTPLNSTEVGQVNLSVERELLLCEPSLQAQTPDVLTDYHTPIHPKDGALRGL